MNKCPKELTIRDGFHKSDQRIILGCGHEVNHAGTCQSKIQIDIGGHFRLGEQATWVTFNWTPEAVMEEVEL